MSKSTFRNLITILLVPELLFSAGTLCACKKSEPTPPLTSIAHIEYPDTVITSVIYLADDPSESSSENTTATDPEWLPYNTKLVSFNASRSYVFDKGNLVDEDTECLLRFIRDPKNKETNYFSVKITSETAAKYREWLRCYVSLEDYSEGKLETVSIGGLDFISFQKTAFTSYGNLEKNIYFHRDERSGMSIVINLGPQTPAIKEILSDITFTLPDSGLSDPPFPWQHDTPDIASTENTISDYKIECTHLPFDPRVYTSGSSDGIVPISYTAAQAGVSTSYLYTIDLKTDSLLIYHIGEQGLELVRTTPLPDKGAFGPETITGEATIERKMVSDNSNYTFLIEKGETTDLIQIYSDVAISPDDSMLIKYDYNAIDIQKLTYEASTDDISSVPFTFGFPIEEAKILDMNISENYILVMAAEKTSSSYHQYVFDHDGRYLMELKDEKGEAGSMEDIYEVSGGFLALDTFPLQIRMWKEDGTYLGSLSEQDLTGLEDLNDDIFQTASLNQIRKVKDENGENTDLLLIMSHFDEGVQEDLAFKITVKAQA